MMFNKFCLVIFGFSLGWSQSLEIINYDKLIDIVWNVPTFQCRSHKIHFEDLLTDFGIIVNENGDFKGSQMTILYDPGSFPAIFQVQNTTNNFLRNGGVPQNGNLDEHLNIFKERVETDIPFENYTGYAVIDFESWRPLFRQNWASLQPYKDLSIKLETNLHPDWNKTQITKEATRRFEKSGRKFVEETLTTAKKLRPHALWGYYAYPYCFNMQSNNKHPFCDVQVKEENDELNWMFEAGDSLHPSLYLAQKGLTPEERLQLIEGRIYEAIRINGNLKEKKKIIPYFWHLYRDTYEFLTKKELTDSFHVMKSLGVDGIILWGSSNDVNTKEKCKKLYNYIETTLGPLSLTTNLP